MVKIVGQSSWSVSVGDVHFLVVNASEKWKWSSKNQLCSTTRKCMW